MEQFKSKNLKSITSEERYLVEKIYQNSHKNLLACQNQKKPEIQ